MPKLRERLAGALFGDLIEARVREAVRVVDDRWWAQIGGAAGTNDLAWADRQQDLADALDAWRSNPLARQIVRLTRGFVLQDGISFKSEDPVIQCWVDEFWNHAQNRMAARMRVWCDALTISGEVFPVLFLNKADGMVYVRSIPAKSIDDIETDPEDLESERRYHQLIDGDVEGRWWSGPAGEPNEGRLMLHYAVNRVEGAVRGSGDLDPDLPWLKRYKEWLLDRPNFTDGARDPQEHAGPLLERSAILVPAPVGER